MPLGRAPLTQKEIDEINAWIKKGKKELQESSSN